MFRRCKPTRGKKMRRTETAHANPADEAKRDGGDRQYDRQSAEDVLEEVDPQTQRRNALPTTHRDALVAGGAKSKVRDAETD